MTPSEPWTLTMNVVRPNANAWTLSLRGKYQIKQSWQAKFYEKYQNCNFMFSFDQIRASTTKIPKFYQGKLGLLCSYKNFPLKTQGGQYRN